MSLYRDAAQGFMLQAACLGMPRFTEDYTVPEQRAFCQRACLVREECLAYGKASKASGTVYGGRKFPLSLEVR